MENTGQAVIGLRKMGVIMCCVIAITVIVFLHLHYNKTITENVLYVCGLIGALGGIHNFKQSQIDAKAKKVGGV